MADIVKPLLLSLLSEKCYDEYFANYNFLDGNYLYLVFIRLPIYLSILYKYLPNRFINC